MGDELIQPSDDRVAFTHESNTLFEYDCRPDVSALESPRPYLHPLRTLAGEVVSDYRPADHLWHLGLSMTCADLGGTNYWGGGSYMKESGRYERIPNQGRQEHVRWNRVELVDGLPIIEHELQWIDREGERVIREVRSIRVGKLDTDAGYWRLDWSSALTNTTDKTLQWGSPTTRGRPNAGYGGLFWRGSHDATPGRVFTPDGLSDCQTIMGQRSPWLAYVMQHQNPRNHSTLVFFDSPANPRYPNKWFVRSDTTPMVCFAFMFDELFPHEAGQTLSLNYSILIVDGELDATGVERLIADASPQP
ncbi:MAG: hypothetical protein GC164_13995 [Phycisphaera sp.]|nr:hypothetical protein [Phycisphaera sp.]